MPIPRKSTLATPKAERVIEPGRFEPVPSAPPKVAFGVFTPVPSANPPSMELNVENTHRGVEFRK